MTLQLRPTFSESWYRVADLRVRLRVSAHISRQFYRGDRWYVVRDPAGNQFHRLSDPAYKFVGLLDGSRTVEEAWELCGGQLADDAPTQPEVIQILSHLYSANLIEADVTPDATVLLRRHKQLTKRKMQGRLMNVLFPRIPLWDPDRFLKQWMPLARVAFSKFGALIWLAVVVFAVAMVAPTWAEPHGLRYSAVHAVDIRGNTINLLWLWAVFVFIKLIHELGHAFSCRRFGGECHELGIMFLVFVPTPYVDASSAWSFRSKWERIFVGAAGMIVELFFAALCSFIWRYSNDTSLIRQLAFNAMLVASVTTIVFNANPLLRYDGYYILADWLEIPNLRQKSTDYAMGLIKRHIFGVKLQQPLPPPLQRVWLLLYALFSSIYRIFVGVVIILLVAYQIPVLGVLMAVGGVATWLIVPVFKVFKYLALDPELHRKRTRASAFCVAVAVAAVVVFGLIRFPMHVQQVGVAEATAHAQLNAERGGFVTQIKVRDHQWVHGPHDGQPGDVLLVCSDPELDSQIAQKQAEIRGAEAKVLASRAEDPSQESIDQEVVDTLKTQLSDMQRRHDELIVRAPIDGELIAPDIDLYSGRYLQKGQQICTIARADELTVKVLLQQAESQLIMGRVNKTAVRFAGDLGTVVSAGAPRPMGAAKLDLPSPAVAQPAGEEEPVDPKDPTKSQTEQFEVDVPVQNPSAKYYPGQRAYVRFTLDRTPLFVQWKRRFLQVLQTKNNPWM
jgi:putative peptide zinc metalloprotease protein